MLMAASVTKSGRGYPGASMTKTWLMRRAVRSFSSLTIAPMNSSVWRLPFISASTLRSRRSGVAMFGRYQFIAGKIELGLLRCGSDLGLRPDQDGDDEFFLGGFDRAKQRNRIDRMHDSRADRCQPTCLFDEFLVVT